VRFESPSHALAESYNLPMSYTAILAGATGLIGGHLLHHLTASADYPRVIALSRRPIPQHANLETRIVNFDSLSPADSTGADVVFCALGTTIKKAGSQEAFRRVDFGYVKAIADAVHAAGAQQFVLVSSVGADPHSSNFYLRVKGEVEQAVIFAGFAAVHIFRPSLLLGDRPESRLGEGIGRVLMPILNPLMVGGLRKYRAIQSEQVARAMVTAPLNRLAGVHIYQHDDIIQR